jgi:hypothetical protein
MSKRKVTILLTLAAISFFIANVTAKLSAAIPVTVMQIGATATPPQSRTPRPAPRASATLSTVLVIIEQDTQLFAQPDNTSEILFPLPKTGSNFAHLLSITLDHRWYQIEIGTNIGWVSSAAARIIGDRFGVYDFATQASTASVPGATPTIAPIATERMVGAFPTIRFTRRVDVYPEPSTFVPSIGIIVPGQTAEVLAFADSQFDWYLVRYENGAGWIWDQSSDDIQGDTIHIPQITASPQPTADYANFIGQSPGEIESFLASPTPAPPGPISPTQVPGPAHVADQIDMLLEPDIPLEAYTPEQIAAAADTVRARIAQYPVTDYTVEADSESNTIHVRFADNYYRDEIISVVQQEGLFEAVNFSDQSVELRAALLHETILTSGYRKRESEQIRNMNEIYNTNSMGILVDHGFAFSERLRNPLEINHPFNTVLDDQSVAGASLVAGHNWDVIVTLTDEGAERLSHYPLNSFIAFTMDGTILAIPLAVDVIPSPFTLTLHYEEFQARMLVVLLRSRSLPFALRPRTITYVNNN